MNLTIIIPTYNHNGVVEECVLALDHNDAEIIIVDDGSELPVELPPQIGRVIRHERRRGRAAAINTGLHAASHDLVLIINDDIYASPDMVVRLVDEFSLHNNHKLGLAARVVWDPDLPLTLTMKWMEQTNKFQPPMLLWNPFVLEQGGYDEHFSRRLEDVEVHLRLKQEGFELRTVAASVGFQHCSVKIRELIEREFLDGVSSVFLHSKFPDFMPQVDDMSVLLRNEEQGPDAEAAVDEIALLEQSGSSVLPAGATELYTQVCRYYLLHGIYEGLKDIGDIKPRRSDSTTLPIYNHASFLAQIGELDEARRLFQLVRERHDEEYWDGAEYHLGCIETELGNPDAAHSHFLECLRHNPGHSKARGILNKPAGYEEVESNVFKSIDLSRPPRVLFVLFGGLSNVINAFPVVSALRDQLRCKTVWLTSPDYLQLVKASTADDQYQMEPHDMVPWEWIQSQGFTHVFFAEPEANREEWQQSRLHPVDFMAMKCGVKADIRRARLQPDREAIREAEEFIRRHDLTRGGFITASTGDGKMRHWPNSSLMKLARYLDMPTIVFGNRTDSEIPGTIPCIDKPFQVIAALIGASSFYLGPLCGDSWLASTTDTPMVVFADPRSQNMPLGLRDALGGERQNVQEWDIYTSLPTVLSYMEPRLIRSSERPALIPG